MLKNKTIAIIGTNGLPGRYGGWDQLMNHLITHLGNIFSFIVYTSTHNAVKGMTEFNGAELKVVPLKANGIQSIPYDIVSMIHAIYKRYDVLLILGTSGCVFLPVARIFGKKIILNIDGAEWKRGKWGRFAKSFLHFSEKIGVKYSNVVISDNKVIQDYVLEAYGVQSELIAYGGDNATHVPMSPATALKYSISPGDYAFKVCRIEPENNLDLILESFSTSALKLIIVGNWEFSTYGRNLRAKYSETSNITLLDPIYDQKQLDELRGNCGMYVHGHSVGGTNPSLVEAMNLGLFCVVFKVSYNIETTENEAIYFSSEHDLKEILREFCAGKIDRNLYCTKMLEIAKTRYRWEVITNQYRALFVA